jgi:hypothetical protein
MNYIRPVLFGAVFQMVVNVKKALPDIKSILPSEGQAFEDEFKRRTRAIGKAFLAESNWDDADITAAYAYPPMAVAILHTALGGRALAEFNELKEWLAQDTLFEIYA